MELTSLSVLIPEAGVIIGTARRSSDERMDMELVREGSCELSYMLILPVSDKLLSSVGDSERGESNFF